MAPWTGTILLPYKIFFDEYLIINPRRACAERVTVFGLCVCVSITSNLGSHAIMHPTRNTNGFSNDMDSKLNKVFFALLHS